MALGESLFANSGFSPPSYFSHLPAASPLPSDDPTHVGWTLWGPDEGEATTSAEETAEWRQRGTHLPQGTRGTSGKILVRLGTEPNQEIPHGISEGGPRGTHLPQGRRGTSGKILVRPGTERNQEIAQGISEGRTRGTHSQDTRGIHGKILVRLVTEINREILQHPPYIDRAFPPPASTNMSPSIAPSNDDQPAQPPGHQLASNDTSTWAGQLETFSLDHQMRPTSRTGEGSPQRRYQTPCPDACHCHNPAREKTDILRETHAPTLQCPSRITVTTSQLLHRYDRGRAQNPEVLMLSNSKLCT